MGILNEESFSELIVDREGQAPIRRQRAMPYIERKVRKQEFKVPDDGWYVLDDTPKRDIKLAKDKPTSEQFEDNVWVLLSQMGYRYLSKDRNLRIQYEMADGATQQVDVLAVDDECALIVECKCAEGNTPKVADFKTQIESLGAKKAGLHREIRERFNNPHLKIAYVLATKNYIIKPMDVSRLGSFQIHHFSEVDLEYYRELINHLGVAARYQFEADLFANQDIPSIEGRVYAVMGSMGGIDYYSFSIEPERLLKLGYVLHRSKSIKTLPSYQRLIKKNRLTAIRKFVNSGGYFPNSIIVSIDSNGKKIPFDQASPSIEGSHTRLGVLHLPKRYRSMYVIDGQHRLYGYSETEYASKNSIPVIAFVDLERDEQLRLFMEINENQKSVSKNLKHTLDADLKWDSKNLSERAEGIKKQLAQELGESISSPLYNRVLVGEDQRTETRVITLEAILRGLNQTKFVGKFTKDAVKEQGQFNGGESERTVERIRLLLTAYFTYFVEEYPTEWARLPKEGALLTINDGVTALISLLGDVVDHMFKNDEIKPLSEDPEDIIATAKTYLDGLKPYLTGLSETDRAELRRKYGSGAPTRLRRIFQRAIQRARPEFNPPGLFEFWRDQSKQYNIDTYSRVADIELNLREHIKDALMKSYGSMWLKKGMSEKLYTQLSTEAAKKNRLIENEGDEKSPWDCINLIHIRDILTHGNQWQTLFQKAYTIPGQEGRRKDEKSSWLVKLNGIRNNADHEYSVSKEDADYVAAVHDWLMLGDAAALSAISTPSSTAEPEAESAP